MTKHLDQSAAPPREPTEPRAGETPPRIDVKALREELERLTLLSPEELIEEIGAYRLGKSIERLLACNKNKDMHLHSDGEIQSKLIADRYAEFSALCHCRTNEEEIVDELLPDQLPVSIPGVNIDEVIEVSGHIKWFDASKGYGFVVLDNGLHDALLHITCLRSGGYQTAYEGARLTGLALVRPKGIQFFHIQSMDESTAIDPSQLPQRTHVHVVPESDWQQATVKWFNRVRGFGFLSLGEGKADIFVHMETLRRFGFTELRPGQTVNVRWGFGCKGQMAAELGPAPPATHGEQ